MRGRADVNGAVGLGRRALLGAAAATLLAGVGEAPVGTLAVFGDSQAEGLVVGLRRLARKRPDDGIVITNRTKAGTAISQPPYDWPAAIAEYVATVQPRAATALCFFGGNDRLPMRPAGTPVIPFRTPAWEAIYRDRLTAMMTTMATAGIRVTWLGQPVCRDARYNTDMEWLNTLFESVAQAVSAANPQHPPVRFDPLWRVVADANGGFQPYGPGPDGKPERLRLDDGIHFTPAGYEMVARHVVAGLAPGATP